jgi:carnitine O-acetyltransferase
VKQHLKTFCLHFLRTLERICSECDTKGVPIGVLTAENRGRWFHIREHLNELNPEALEAIQSAMFILCLDDDSPKTNEEASRLLLSQNATNRWFDKSIQFVVFENGMAGLIGEVLLQSIVS